MKRLHYIFLLFSTVLSYGQVTLQTFVNEKDFKVDQKFTLTVIMEIQGENMVQQSKLKLPDFSKFNMIGNASEQNTVRTGNDLINQIIYQCVLEPKEAGILKIGSALVTVNNKIYKTEPFEIEVKEAEKKSMAKNDDLRKERNDVFLNVEVDKEEVYKNQPTVAVLRAYSRNYHNFRKVKNIQFPQQDNLVIKPVSQQKSDIESSRDNLPSQILAIYMVFPSEDGNVEMKPVSANLATNNKTILSNKVTLKVKELPKNAPKNYKNAVGKFEVEIVNPTPEKIEVKKPLNVLVKISGEGNFTNLELPEIESSPNYTVYKPKITDKTKLGENGIEGEIFANYVVIPKRAGAFKIDLENFSFFNPQTAKYVELGQKSLEINAFTHDEMLSTRTPLERVNDYTNTVLETVDPVIQTDNLKVQQKEKINWKTIVLNLLILIVLILAYLFFKKWQKNKGNSTNNLSQKPVENVTETEDKIRGELQTDTEDYFSYLKKSVQKENYNEFFKTFSELNANTYKQYHSFSESEFLRNLTKEKGQQIAEEFRELQQKVQMEKYAPIHQQLELNDLLNSIIKLYSQIKK